LVVFILRLLLLLLDWYHRYSSLLLLLLLVFLLLPVLVLDKGSDQGLKVEMDKVENRRERARRLGNIGKRGLFVSVVENRLNNACENECGVLH